MIKKIIAGFCLLVTSIGFSQENNASPYSYYGLGDQKFRGTVENKSMGGLSIVSDSIHLNLQNPAGYSNLKFTTFTVGAGVTNTKFKTTTEQEDADRASVDYIAVGLPLNKVAFAFGIMPYTSVGYKIETAETGSDGFERFKRFEGSGGLNRVFGGVSYKISSKFSVGADLAYDFGNIETSSLVGMQQVQYPTRENNNSHYGGMAFNFGAIYNTRINNKYTWTSAATFSPQANLKSSTDRQISTVTLNNAGNEVTVDLIDAASYDEDVKLPMKFSFGTGLGQARKWFAGAEYTFQESNELGNRFDEVTDAKFDSAYKLTLGGYYIPNYNSFTSYISRVTYRAGFRYENTGLIINNEQIKDYAFTLGLGLPVGQSGGSNVNIGAEFGKRGTTNAGLVQEKYVNIYISLSFNDRWFVKRRYD